MSKLNGGIIGPDNVPTGAFGSASGVWSLSDVTNYKKQGTWPIVLTGHQVANSLRFDDGSSDSLSRSFGTPSSTTTWTISFWVKKCANGSALNLCSQGVGTSNEDRIRFDSSDRLEWTIYKSAVKGKLVTNRLFRDNSAWYNVICRYDSTNGTAGDRMRMYVNGIEETSFSTDTNPNQNETSNFNTSATNYIGSVGSGEFFDGYMAETVFIDGTALDPTSFGETDSVTNNWVPKDVSGLTFGNNGFYLDFKDSSALGNDANGSNNFTVNNLTSIDQSTDTCTNNFATFNPLSKNDSGTITFSNGNLTTAHSGSDSVYSSYSTIGVSSGKWYTEFKVDASANPDIMTGIGSDIENANRTGGYLGSSSSTWGYDSTDGSIYNNGSSSSYGNSYANGDIIGIALDLDNNKLYFSKNGTFQNSGDPTSGATGTGAISITANETYFMCCGHASTTTRTSTYSANFGSPPFSISSGNVDFSGMGNFEYAVPSGYYSLCTRNLNLIG